jgi:hypothetical protein
MLGDKPQLFRLHYPDGEQSENGGREVKMRLYLNSESFRPLLATASRLWQAEQGIRGKSEARGKN